MSKIGASTMTITILIMCRAVSEEPLINVIRYRQSTPERANNAWERRAEPLAQHERNGEDDNDWQCDKCDQDAKVLADPIELVSAGDVRNGILQ